MSDEKSSSLMYLLGIVFYTLSLAILLNKTFNINIMVSLIISILALIVTGLSIKLFNSESNSKKYKWKRWITSTHRETFSLFIFALIFGLSFGYISYIYEGMKDSDSLKEVAFDETRLLQFENGVYQGQISETGSEGCSYFAALLRENGFSASNIITTKPITYEKLKRYDVLIILSSSQDFSSSEVEAIEKFVNNGGGLLLVVDTNWRNLTMDYPANTIAKRFGVNFAMNGVIYDAIDHYGKTEEYRNIPIISDIKSHEITTNVSDFFMTPGTYIKNTGSSNVLAYSDRDAWFDNFIGDEGIKEIDEINGPFPILSEMSYGKGKIVFIPDNGLFLNSWMKYYENNAKLGLNIVKWLAVHT